jgi:hypothetical protein
MQKRPERIQRGRVVDGRGRVPEQAVRWPGGRVSRRIDPYGCLVRVLRLRAFDPGSGQGTEGVYHAYFTRPLRGGYTFHLFGSIRGQKVSITVKSSPTAFGSVPDP